MERSKLKVTPLCLAEIIEMLWRDYKIYINGRCFVNKKVYHVDIARAVNVRCITIISNTVIKAVKMLMLKHGYRYAIFVDRRKSIHKNSYILFTCFDDVVKYVVTSVVSKNTFVRVIRSD